MERLEARLPAPEQPPRSPTTEDEIRALEKHIAGLEAEILAEGGTVEPLDPPDDLEEAVREIAELEAKMLAEGGA